MENSSKSQERGTPTLLPSPTSLSTNSSSSSSGSSNGGNTTNALLHHHHHQHGLQNHQQHPPTPPPTTPKQQNQQQQQQQQQNHVQPITRSEPNNPYPTTFVQADTSSFKQVVQMLTGSSETAKQASQSRATGGGGGSPDQPPKNPIPPIKTASKAKPSRLYERRNTLKNLRINPLHPGLASNGGFSPRNAEILSPSILDFPALVLSPVTPLIPDPFNKSPISNWATPNNSNIIVDKAAEEKAIAEKGFFLHPSPASTPRDSEPRLLPLFPVTSPRVSGSDS